MADYGQLGRLIRGKRNIAGKTLSLVAERAGIDGFHLADMESGKAPVDADMLVAIGCALEIHNDIIERWWIDHQKDKLAAARYALVGKGKP